MNPIEETIPAAPSGLRRAHKMVGELQRTRNLSREVVFALNVVLDELISNIIKYAYSDEACHAIRLKLSANADFVEIQIEDDGKPFNPLKAPAPDLTSSLSGRPVGGLGVHFVRSLMDAMEYARLGPLNRLTLRKRLHASKA